MAFTNEMTKLEWCKEQASLWLESISNLSTPDCIVLPRSSNSPPTAIINVDWIRSLKHCIFNEVLAIFRSDTNEVKITCFYIKWETRKTCEQNSTSEHCESMVQGLVCLRWYGNHVLLYSMLYLTNTPDMTMKLCFQLPVPLTLLYTWPWPCNFKI